MLSAYRQDEGRLTSTAMPDGDLAGIVWIDLQSPTPDEERVVETAVGLDIPTRDDMQEIEVSSRLYGDSGALFLTAQVLATSEGREAELGPVTFVIAGERLITVRYHEPGSFRTFVERAASQPMACVNGPSTALALLETVVDRLADILEGEARKLAHLSKAIFEAHRPSGRSETLSAVLQRIGRAEELNGKVSESLSTLSRLLGYLSTPSAQGLGKMLKGIDKVRLKTLLRDVRSLQDTASTHGQKILFQLDATLGVISIRQADVIKIFSVVAFVFLPPTLIASVYGMNFKIMPELDWLFGYPMAIGLMVLSALVPYLVFRWKKWL
jgi:magnesium transporter